MENEGVSVKTLPADDNGQVDVNSLCVALGNELYQHVLFEGGTQLAGSMWRAGLIQRVQIYLAPKIYAGDDGFSLFGGHGPAEMSSVYNLENVRFDQCGTDLVIEGDVPNVYRAD